MSEASQFSELSVASSTGARQRLWTAVYEDLCRMAHARLRNQSDPDMPGTTSLAHQVYTRLAGVDSEWQDRGHFLRFASATMRNLLVDEARVLQRRKRNQISAPAETEAANSSTCMKPFRILAVEDQRLASIVECRFFAGLTVEETAEALDLSPATVKRGWDTARAWLYKHLHSPST